MNVPKPASDLHHTIMSAFVCCSLALLCAVTAVVAQEPRPDTPSWPEKFNIQFDVLVEDYGPHWRAVGRMNYNWAEKTFRADFMDWCLPLFDDSKSSFDNYTCSFLATKGNMYSVNHTSKEWKENKCCLFDEGLGAVAPDWMKVEQYNGTLPYLYKGKKVDIWWFPGTSDPSKPCYAYWSIRDEVNTPYRFFGLSSLGPTILNYYLYQPGVNEEGKDLSVPNADCEKECEPPMSLRGRNSKMKVSKDDPYPWPSDFWPSCG